jgi:hypothetical protein
MFFAVAFVHFDGVTWQMVECHTICLHSHWKRSKEWIILQALSSCMISNWMPNVIIMDNGNVKSMF